ncbi:hypothetical protein KW782_02505 [Candidatus Parcubacteria bacterium]|nr:hypothetical protein [Candidatus Parcubacteria bacterium]
MAESHAESDVVESRQEKPWNNARRVRRNLAYQARKLRRAGIHGKNAFNNGTYENDCEHVYDSYDDEEQD